MSLHPVLTAVTERVITRSARTRRAYLDLIARERENGISRPRLACGNLAHAIAASGNDKAGLRAAGGMNVGIITAYNDMLSAHQPYGRYPDQIKLFAREVGGTAQVAGGTPAMCDGVTQGQPGMEISLFSRDVIALSTAVGLSHGMYEGVAMLGICDKIVPGLLMGALRFGHLPTILIPSGPMPSGLPNSEKQRIRQLYAEGKVGKDKLMDAESESYHAAGTCTFYGTANTNQMLMEVMGLHLPGSSFVPPNSRLRQELTRAAIHRLSEIGARGEDYRPLGLCVDERAIVNAAVGLLATGGSTNLAIHIPAMARAAGIIIDWTDLDQLSAIVPQLTRVYPNGSEDVNAFHDVGGMPSLIGSLLDAGLLHPDILTVARGGFSEYRRKPELRDDKVVWEDAGPSTNENILRAPANPFRADGGMKVMEGNLGRGIYKTSSVAPERWTIEAPAAVFDHQEDVLTAFRDGKLDRDVVVVVRFQGPAANGMPELHKLTPTLAVLQDRGHKVALVTDGRMSGASGKVPAAIHIGPEAYVGGPLSLLRDGDVVRVCARTGRIEALVEPGVMADRTPARPPAPQFGTGRELFALMRNHVDLPEQGASAILASMDHMAAQQNA
ncbi:phosphogluconate dehydratase [Komagataeibacter nataicola]|uniref:Phosphogluconate dehydratase n=1 Tax=Komagataeibacter nataicola TaxID=265960 RepID=A0A9N7C9H4_9PROT|nr:phosphogluconate dehydratase [Komagataeibacter nataicola]AQU88106.1 phosphogluconate dehydratase [Komagataeibacter nataicola]PYD66906.1 phosphogluconate dehydratase [Komagataeibacter nataicola]WEQ54798.1 phosphogluconate dehydratase [Komagataeibacter nataicola]WNM09145.1 phosphogluconate dehydratase [Komagataeibacter nataicola]GBR20488.1 phosphogluconate dehydratase [Komagataeibacter nataicola NRIC 0616]